MNPQSGDTRAREFQELTLGEYNDMRKEIKTLTAENDALKVCVRSASQYIQNKDPEAALNQLLLDLTVGFNEAINILNKDRDKVDLDSDLTN